MKKIFIILAALITLCAVVPYALALTPQFQYDPLGTLTTGLISYYNMQGNSNDYWGTNNGTDTSIPYGSSYGKVNYGAGFNGTASFINLGTPTNLNITGNISINAWYMPTNFTNEAAIVSNYNSAGTAAQYQVKIATTGDLVYNINNSSQQTADSGFPLTSGVWNMVTVTNDNSNIRLYVNGSLKATIAQSQTPPTTGFGSTAIGRAGSYNGVYANGAIDEVGIWTKVLSSTEISDLYNGGAGQTMCNGTGGPVCAGGSSPKMSFNWITLNWKPEPIA